MKVYQHRFLSLIPILTLVIICLSNGLQSCDNPYARSVSERDKLEAEKDSIKDAHSCEIAKQDQIIADQQEAFFKEQYINSLRQDSIAKLKKRNYGLSTRKRQLENARDNLISARDSLQRLSQNLKSTITKHREELEEYYEMDSISIATIESKEQKIMKLEQEFDHILTMIKKSLKDDGGTGESYVVSGKSSGNKWRDEASNYLVNHDIAECNEFASELQVSLFAIPQDVNGKTVHKRNAMRFRERWRSLDVTASISHPNQDKLNSPNFLNELVAIVKNYHDGSSSFHHVTEIRQQQDMFTVPVTDNPVKFQYHIDKQARGSHFGISLYYKNPISHKLVFLTEQTIFKEKKTPTRSSPSPRKESYSLNQNE